MAEIIGTTSLETKLAIQSAGDVIARVRGKRAVVSAQGFEHHMTGHDSRVLAKTLDGDAPTSNTHPADAATQALIDAVAWPEWPQVVRH
jgi:hypothetical protein